MGKQYNCLFCASEFKLKHDLILHLSRRLGGDETHPKDDQRWKHPNVEGVLKKTVKKTHKEHCAKYCRTHSDSISAKAKEKYRETKHRTIKDVRKHLLKVDATHPNRQTALCIIAGSIESSVRFRDLLYLTLGQNDVRKWRS